MQGCKHTSPEKDNFLFTKIISVLVGPKKDPAKAMRREKEKDRDPGPKK